MGATRRPIDLRRLIGLILMGIGLLLPIVYFGRSAATEIAIAPTIMITPSPTNVPERLIPTVPPRTATATPVATSLAPRHAATRAAPPTTTPRSSMATAVPTTSIATRQAVTPMTTVAPISTVTIASQSSPAPPVDGPPYSLRQRTGIGVGLPQPWIDRLGRLGAGWYLNWSYTARASAGMEFVQMIRLSRGVIRGNLDDIANAAQQTPGSLWLIGNEPDVIWQDNSTPDEYAAAYHTAYTTIKTADPTARIAIGGVSQPTPLRLQYLDLILASYQAQFGAAMPIDVWNVHNFILQEKRGDWGVDIPPGLSADSGRLYTIDDHDRLDIFRQQLVEFRTWLAARGFRDKELIVSEYGALMPPDYGFPYERVRDFMLGSFDVMQTAADGSIGLASDGHRLVQRWCWYSLSDDRYPTGNLVDRETGEITSLGLDFMDYLGVR